MAVPPYGPRVLIVDDNAAFATALQMLIETDGRFEVVGRASNGDEAFEFAARFRPDIVTMDLQMPVRDGVEATRMIAAYFPATAVVVISASPWLLDEALAAGAVAHVPKEDVADRLFDVLGAIGQARAHDVSSPKEDVARVLRLDAPGLPSPAPSLGLGEASAGERGRLNRPSCERRLR
jgi:two-component system, chemotaxis family, protein-glutamate methylesterase/glutaminase